jgi:hypothetical protein
MYAGDTFIDTCHALMDTDDAFINTSDTFIDTDHPFIDTGHSVVDASHSIIDDKYIVPNFPDFAIDGMRDLQKLRGGHSSLLLRQSVQSLQRRLNIILSHQFLQILF